MENISAQRWWMPYNAQDISAHVSQHSSPCITTLYCRHRIATLGTWSSSTNAKTKFSHDNDSGFAIAFFLLGCFWGENCWRFRCCTARPCSAPPRYLPRLLPRCRFRVRRLLGAWQLVELQFRYLSYLDWRGSRFSRSSGPVGSTICSWSSAPRKISSFSAIECSFGSRPRSRASTELLSGLYVCLNRFGHYVSHHYHRHHRQLRMQRSLNHRQSLGTHNMSP